MLNPTDVVVSPDGFHVYVITAFETGGILTFQRSGNGSLVQLAGGNGCVVGADGADCATNTWLAGARRMAFSPNGRRLYVATSEGRLVTLSRDPSTGALTQIGCLSSNAEGDVCPQHDALSGMVDIAVSSDGKNVYTVSKDEFGASLARYIRKSDGTLDPVSCYGPGLNCTGATGLADPRAVAVSPDGKSVYVGSGFNGVGTVFVFNRSTTSTPIGALTTPSGTAKCISQTGSGGACANGHGLGNVDDVVVAPDSKTVYAASNNATQSVAVLRRGSTGLLSQPTGSAGCVSDIGADGCATGKGLFVPKSLAVSVDGNSLYVAAESDGLSGFKRISPPQTTITRGPSGETTDRTPTYRFKSSEAHSTFQCKIDDGTWKSCTSPRTLAKQSYGKHVFKVRARDAVGTFDPTPAKRRFKVVRS
jgi:DNA-binding beta-propeller fold protein YncE